MRVIRFSIIVTVVTLLSAFSWAADEAGGVKPETTALYQKARDQVTRLNTSPAARYAPEIIKQAVASIESAQNGLKAGNDQATRQHAELAATQAKLALALADERIAAEKTTAARKELKELEQRLATILSGKGEKP